MMECPMRKPLFDVDHADLVDEAVGHYRVAIRQDAHVSHDVAAAGNGPTLEFFRRWIEANDRIRLGIGLVVPDRPLSEYHAIGFGFRAAKQKPFLDRAGRQIALADKAARKIRVTHGTIR